MLSADGRLLIGEDLLQWMIQAYWSKRNLGDASWPREMDGSEHPQGKEREDVAHDEQRPGIAGKAAKDVATGSGKNAQSRIGACHAEDMDAGEAKSLKF